MKRYIIGLTLASALTMGLTSCSDFLADYRLLQVQRV